MAGRMALVARTAFYTVPLGCFQPGNTPQQDACDQFIEAADERSCRDLSPFFYPCSYYGREDFDTCDIVSYFYCLRDVVVCDPETGEPYWLAMQPCVAFADCEPLEGE